MALLLWLLAPLHGVNSIVLRIGMVLAAAALAVMVAVILAQVWYRYVLGTALPWPDEAARFLMLWMTGLIAPAAYRRGGFVAIDMVERALPRLVATVLSLILLTIAFVVLIFLVRISYAEVTGFSGRFATASLYLPTSLSFDDWYRIPRSWMMASIFVGIVLLISVSIELLLRQIITLMGGEERLPALPIVDVPEAE